jgi:hypothetical protein
VWAHLGPGDTCSKPGRRSGGHGTCEEGKVRRPRSVHERHGPSGLRPQASGPIAIAFTVSLTLTSSSPVTPMISYLRSQPKRHSCDTQLYQPPYLLLPCVAFAQAPTDHQTIMMHPGKLRPHPHQARRTANTPSLAFDSDYNFTSLTSHSVLVKKSRLHPPLSSARVMEGVEKITRGFETV